MLVETGEEDLREPERWDFFCRRRWDISERGKTPGISCGFFLYRQKGKFGGCARQVRPPTGLKRIGCRTLPVKTGLTLF